MALNPVAIKTQIDQLLSSSENVDLSVKEAKEKFSQDLTDIIVNAIKSAQVTVNIGIPVQVAVPAGTGSTIGAGTGFLS